MFVAGKKQVTMRRCGLSLANHPITVSGFVYLIQKLIGMRKLFACFLSMLLTVSILAQQITPDQKFSRQDYLQKSEKQKKTGWIVLGSGAALIITGFIIGNSGEDEASFDKAMSGGLFIVAGSAATIISIPIFIASGRNKKKAAAATSYFEFRTENFTTASLPSARSFPALAIKLTL